MKKFAVIAILAAALCGVLLGRLAFRNEPQDAGTERFAVVVPPTPTAPNVEEVGETKSGREVAPYPRWTPERIMLEKLKDLNQAGQLRLIEDEVEKSARQGRLIEDEVELSARQREELMRLLTLQESRYQGMSGSITLSPLARKYELVADAAREFDEELVRGQFGFFANTQNRIRKIVSDNSATVMLRPASKPNAEKEVLITGILTAGYQEDSPINLFMPFEVLGQERVGEKKLVRLHAVPLYPK